MSNIAVIPARGGSTRLKDKNIYNLGGRPLIYWTIDAVLKSECFDRIIVSSDSSVILTKVFSFYRSSIELHKRPLEQATKQAKVLDAMLNIVDTTDSNIFGYFLPTCPFRNKDHIIEGYSLLSDSVDSVVSVVPYSEPIQLAGSLNGEFFEPYFDNLQENKTNSLFMDKYYRPNGGFYMAHTYYLRHHRNFFVGKTKGYVMDKIYSHDINDSYDMVIADTILKEGLL
jgi:CMP-N-acetylneuraminic acid synthetase